MRATRVSACLFALVVVAAGIGADAQDGEVPLYTNEDLDRFGPAQTPAPDPPPPSVEDVDRQWDFVQEHLDRERARIQTDRALSIEESLAEPAPENEPYVGYPIYGRFGYNGYPYRYGHVRPNRYHIQPYPYDRRTARHGYYLPRKDAPPTPEPYYRAHRGKRGPEKASHGSRSRTGGQVQGRVVSRGSPSRSGSPGKVTARSGGRSGGSSRGTAGGSRSAGRSSSRGSGSRR